MPSGNSCMAATDLGVARDRHWLVGWILAAAILVRPPLAVVALVLGLPDGMEDDGRLRLVISIGAPSALGLLALVLYNRVVFGTFSIAGGYGDFVGRRLGVSSLRGYVANLFGTFFDGSNGLFAWSPWILVTVLFLLVTRPDSEADWVVPARSRRPRVSIGPHGPEPVLGWAGLQLSLRPRAAHIGHATACGRPCDRT